MDKKTAKKILLEVRENIQRLQDCPGPHDFKLVPPPIGRPWDKKYRCTKCGGIVDGGKYTWYRQGMRHAKAEMEKDRKC